MHIFSALQNDNTGSVFILYIEEYGIPPCIYIRIHMHQYNTQTHYNIDTGQNKMQTQSHTNILSKRKLEDVGVSDD
jgi:hypothetical protein